MNPHTKRWLNTKCMFLWHVLEKSAEGKKTHDMMKQDWPLLRGHPRMEHYRKIERAKHKARKESP